MCRAFLDIHGVLASLTPLYELAGIKEYPGMAYTLDSHGINSEEFFAELDAEFWASLPKTSECDALIAHTVRRFGGDNVYLLSWSRTPAIAAGTFEFVTRQLPEFLHDRLILTKCKALLARPGDTLFDDLPDNLEAFIEAGGDGCLIRRPWNASADLSAT